jgi:hypothetical protein
MGEIMKRDERLKKIQEAYKEFAIDLQFVNETGGSDEDEAEFMTNLAKMNLTQGQETK